MEDLNKGPSLEQQQKERELQQQQEEMRMMMLGQILTPDAKERLSNIRLVKPEKARAIEELLIRMAQSGQLTNKVDDERLKNLLTQVGGEKTSNGPKITFQRKKHFDDSDEDN